MDYKSISLTVTFFRTNFSYEALKTIALTDKVNSAELGHSPQQK